MDSRRGLLDITKIPQQDIEIFGDKAFGRVYVPNDNEVYVYAAPPAKKPKKKSSIQSLEKPGSFPAYLVDKDDNEIALVQTQLEEGQHVLARDVGLKDVYEVAVFKKLEDKDDDMPETGDGIEIISKGYVFKSQIKQLKEKLLRKAEDFKTVENVNIFSSSDLVDDVQQNSFGDCFLLASILSILKKPGGPEYIKNMMVQGDDGYTTVRLFDPTKNFKPVYIRVENSIYYKNGKSEIHHKALWVHVLEKAYTALAIKLKNDTPTYTHPSFREVYGSGGRPKLAYAILTGKEGVETKIEETIYPWQARMDLMDCLPTYFQTMHFFNEIDKDIKVGKKDSDKFEDFVEACSQHDIETLIKFLAKDRDDGISEQDWNDCKNQISAEGEALANYIKFILLDNKKINLNFVVAYLEKYYAFKESSILSATFPRFSLVVKLGEFILNLGGEATKFFDLANSTKEYGTSQEEVADYFHRLAENKFKLPLEIETAFRERAAKMKQINPLGSADYSQEMEDLYKKISTNPSCFVIATKREFSGKVPGLRPRHAYAVVGVYEQKIKGSDKVLKFIRIRNPWGQIGRQYEDWDKHNNLISRGESIAKEVKDGEFDLELSDFERYFHRYTELDFVPPVLVQQNTLTTATVVSTSTATTATIPATTLPSAAIPTPTIKTNAPNQNPSPNPNPTPTPIPHHSPNQIAKPTSQPSFFERHGSKLVKLGIFLLVTGLVIASVFSFGIVGAVAAAITTVGVSTAAATGIAWGVFGVVAVAAGGVSAAMIDSPTNVSIKSTTSNPKGSDAENTFTTTTEDEYHDDPSSENNSTYFIANNMRNRKTSNSSNSDEQKTNNKNSKTSSSSIFLSDDEDNKNDDDNKSENDNSESENENKTVKGQSPHQNLSLLAVQPVISDTNSSTPKKTELHNKISKMKTNCMMMLMMSINYFSDFFLPWL